MKKFVWAVLCVLLAFIIVLITFPDKEPLDIPVATQEFQIVDETRPTFLSHINKTLSDSRSFDVKLWYPEGLGDDVSKGSDSKSQEPPYPLVMYSHGVISMKEEGEKLSRFIAEKN